MALEGYRLSDASCVAVWSAQAMRAERWVAQALETWNAERWVYFGDEAEPGELLSVACTPLLDGSPRAVVVRQAQRMSASRLQALLDSLPRVSLAPGTRLVLMDSSPEGTLVRQVEALSGRGGASVCVIRLDAAPGGSEGNWVEAGLRARGLTFTPGARRLVEAALATAGDRMETELDKLRAYGAGPLDEPTVRSLLARDLVEAADFAETPGGPVPGSESRRFRVAELALAGEAGQALRLSEALEREGLAPAWVWREIGRQAMQVWAVAEELEGRFGPPPSWPKRPPTPAAARRLPPAAARRYIDLARRWGTDGLLRVLEWVALADRDAKRGGLRPDQALHRLLARLALGGGGDAGAETPWPAGALDLSGG